ncbi:Putative uncharacterized transposon-derived protein F52C9.6 [Eumeta japonica]|uniref:Uncharacterized transposon-derived protein F52C9.6 n=1 Tax=Eumeta variegata TaxID=151549 RepID=A0A4C1T9U5_EUMVA|nr:Putative uncharacterized transposon-derived protein F52C9.6 [Eumeta japonica]
MDKSIEILLAKLDEKLNQQTKLITTLVTQNVMAALDEKLRAITEENAQLKNKIKTRTIYRRLQKKLKEMLVSKPRSKESYLSKDTLELLDERRTLISNKGDKERHQKTAKLSKEIKENMRKDHKEKRNKVLEENIKRTGGTKKAMKQLSEHDDLVLLEEDPAAIEQMMQSLANKSREVGLDINASKTKLMTNSRETDIMVDGNKIEYVKEYIYLGQIISPSDEMTKEINRRIA